MSMYCKHCGNQIPDDAKFCKFCGQPVASPVKKESEARVTETQLEEPVKEPIKETVMDEDMEDDTSLEEEMYDDEPEPPKKKHGLAIGIAVLGVAALAAAAAVGGFSAAQSSKYKNLKAAIENDNIKECVEQLEDAETDWKDAGLFGFGEKKDILDQLEDISSKSTEYVTALEDAQKYVDDAEANLKENVFAPEELEQYKNKLEDVKTAITDRKASSVQTAMKKADDSYEAWMKASKDHIEQKIAEYQNTDMSTAESGDKEILQQAIDQVDQLLTAENVDFDQVEKIFQTSDETYMKYVEPENHLNIAVQQIDVTEYPNVRLYLDVTDSYDQVIDHLDGGMFYVRKQDVNGNYIKQQVKAVNQLNEIEALNINMLADVSGSMSGSPLYEAQNIMDRFLNSVQFAAGDMVALTSFSNGVYIEQDFTNDARLLEQAVDNLYTQDMTAFYDALYVSVNKVAARSGARCVIAFTDGMDNYSSCSPSDVIALAQRYHIPIFIIGVGSNDYSEARNIAVQTGGNYYSAVTVADISSIYDQIYKQEKELYMLEFEDTSDVSVFKQSSIVAGYHTAEYGGETTYSYTPNTLVSVNDTSIYTNGPEAVVAAYMVAFADAMTNQSYSYIEPYVLAGSSLEAQQQSYVVRGISEKIDSYEIENVEYTDENNCVVTTRETYFVQKVNEPLALLTQRCKYQVVKTGSTWQMVDFAGKVEVLSKITY